MKMLQATREMFTESRLQGTTKIQKIANLFALAKWTAKKHKQGASKSLGILKL